MNQNPSDPVARQRNHILRMHTSGDFVTNHLKILRSDAGKVKAMDMEIGKEEDNTRDEDQNPNLDRSF